MDTLKSGVEKALFYFFDDVTTGQDLRKVILALCSRRGRGTHSHVLVSFHSTWEVWEEPMFSLSRPGCVLVSSNHPVTYFPDDAVLDYPVGFGEFCDRFDGWLDDNYRPRSGSHGWPSPWLRPSLVEAHGLVVGLRESLGVGPWVDLSVPSVEGEDPVVSERRRAAAQAMGRASGVGFPGLLQEGVSDDGRVFQGYFQVDTKTCHAVYEVAPLLPDSGGYIHPPTMW